MINDKVKRALEESKKLKQFFELDSQKIVNEHFQDPIKKIVRELKEEEMVDDKMKEEVDVETEKNMTEVDLDPTVETEELKMEQEADLMKEEETEDDLKEYEELMGTDAGMVDDEEDKEEEYDVDLVEFEGEENSDLTSKENSDPGETFSDKAVVEEKEVDNENEEKDKEVPVPVAESVKKLKRLVKIRENELKKRNQEVSALKNQFQQVSKNLQEAKKIAMFNKYYNATLRLPGLTTQQKTKITDQFDNAGSINEAKSIYEAYKTTLNSQSNKKFGRMMGNQRQSYNSLVKKDINESTEKTSKAPMKECVSVFKKFIQK